ncbi:FliI/YscN family ATPase [Mariprofundus ferrooxydans]|uniref:FliI/YscN family ATPase n=1 Tax=Mariprofundus ferrooxydans TaxID=314344 RepID=UPI00036C4D1A|nr:FliI/YscN family ATPase [Mariprofundus ferrooxydans]
MTDIALWNSTQRRKVLEDAHKPVLFPVRGKVYKVLGPMLEATGLKASIGHACNICCSIGHNIEAEIVGFRGEHTLLMPVGSTRGIAPGDPIEPLSTTPSIRVGPHLLGRVLDAQGNPMDEYALSSLGTLFPLHGTRLNPFTRHMINTPMQLGVRAIDACMPMGWGQRMGLFAGAGVGKSTLLGMLARNSDAEVNVIALVGERSREVREFLDQALGSEALQHSVVIVATSDMPPVLRVRAAHMATTIAEAFREQGKRVLLLMDSLTRVAQAQREIGLMLGEPPASKGYTPSCFSILAELLERSGPGTAQGGDISAFYTVLVEGDDMRADPIADSAMSVLDGHILLDRKLAEQGHFPAINVLRSISRLDTQLMNNEQMQAARMLRRKMSIFERMEDMISIGAYEQGSNPELDNIIANLQEIKDFLQQASNSCTAREDSAQRLLELVSKMSYGENMHEARNVQNFGSAQRSGTQ